VHEYPTELDAVALRMLRWQIAQVRAARAEESGNMKLFRKKIVTTRGFNIDPPADRQTSECRSVSMKISLQAADKVNR
jgi:hypothetical protein